MAGTVTVPDYLQAAGIRALPQVAEAGYQAITDVAAGNGSTEGASNTPAAGDLTTYGEQLPALLMDMLARPLFRRSLYARDAGFIATTRTEAADIFPL